MVYTEDLKSSAARLVGSSPTSGTNTERTRLINAEGIFFVNILILIKF